MFTDTTKKHNQKCFRGSWSTNQRVCATSTHACREDTVEKLRELHPTDSLDFNTQYWPTTEEIKEHWASDLGQQFLLSRLSIKAIRTYFCTRQALGAADIDGWRGRKHIGRMFQSNNTELHELIRKLLILPYLFNESLPQYAMLRNPLGVTYLPF